MIKPISSQITQPNRSVSKRAEYLPMTKVSFGGVKNAKPSALKNLLTIIFGNTIKEITHESIKRTKFDGNGVKKWEKVIFPNGDFTKTTFSKDGWENIKEYKKTGHPKMPSMLVKSTFKKDGKVASISDYSGKEAVTSHYSREDGKLLWQKKGNGDVVVFDKDGKPVPDPFTQWLTGEIGKDIKP